MKPRREVAADVILEPVLEPEPAPAIDLLLGGEGLGRQIRPQETKQSGLRPCQGVREKLIGNGIVIRRVDALPEWKFVNFHHS